MISSCSLKLEKLKTWSECYKVTYIQNDYAIFFALKIDLILQKGQPWNLTIKLEMWEHAFRVYSNIFWLKSSFSILFHSLIYNTTIIYHKIRYIYNDLVIKAILSSRFDTSGIEIMVGYREMGQLERYPGKMKSCDIKCQNISGLLFIKVCVLLYRKLL